jgi:hypothetical protein
MRTLRVRVTMCEVEPVVVRVLDVPSGVLLPELHQLLQAGLGWTDSHLHQFVADDVSYAMPGLDGFEEDRDERRVPLRALPVRFRYLYDFGDGWVHEVEVLSAGEQTPGCVSGEGACPPEDVGGAPGYAEFREVLSNPDHPEHDHLRGWAGEWSDGFDLAGTDRFVRQMVGEVPEPARLLLSLAGGGVRLTPGGRLPRALVRQVHEQYPDWYPFGRPASIEDDLPPLAALHEVLRDVGLLRLSKGVLSPTRAAGDEVESVRRLRSWFGPDDGFRSILVGEGVAILVADGPSQPDALAARLFATLGGRWVTGDGEPLTERGTCSQLYRLQSTLVGLNLIVASNGTWTAGPSACWLLYRSTGLAWLWSRPTIS